MKLYRQLDDNGQWIAYCGTCGDEIDPGDQGCGGCS